MLQRTFDAMVKRLVCAVGAALLLASCGYPTVHFKAPPGWTDGAAAILPLWIVPHEFKDLADPAQLIVLARAPESSPPRRLVAPWMAIHICGNHPAALTRFKGSLGRGEVQMDAVYTAWGSMHVAAMYARPVGTKANPTAEAAIRSLCASS